MLLPATRNVVINAKRKAVPSAMAAARKTAGIAAGGASRSCHFTADKKLPTADLSDRPVLQKTHMRDITAMAHPTPAGKYLHVHGSEGGRMALSTTSNSDADAARYDDSAASSAARSRPLMAAIRALNSASAKNPMTLFYLFFATRATTWGILCKAFSAAQLCSGPELAIGWLVSRGMSKLRQPANLAMAAAVQKVFPILSEVKVTALVGAITPPPEVKQIGIDFQESIETRKAALRERGGGKSAVADAADKAGAMANKVGEGAMAMADRIQGPVDKYGAALFLSSKVTSIGTFCTAAACVHYGVDVASLMAYIGAPDALNGAGAGMSCMAAAVLVNTFLLPGHLWASVKMSPNVGKAAGEYEKRYYDWVRSLEQREEERAGR